MIGRFACTAEGRIREPAPYRESKERASITEPSFVP
jgi:hypothetical protein